MEIFESAQPIGVGQCFVYFRTDTSAVKDEVNKIIAVFFRNNGGK